MKVNRPRYVYVVAGINDATANYDGAYLIVSEQHACHSTLEKAQNELVAILAEIRKEATEEGYEIEYDMDGQSLSVDFDSGSHEYYRIYKVLVN